MILADVAAEDRHAAHADGQREKRLVHGRHDDPAVNGREIRHKVEPQPLRRTGKRQAVHGQHQHQHQQRAHHVFGHALQPALQIKAQQHKRRYNDHKQVGHVQPGVGDHLRKAEIRVLPGQELDKIVQDPARDHRVERHDGNVADEADDTEYAPLVAGLFQALVHGNGAGLGGAAHGKLHDHDGQAQHQQAEDVEQHKAAAAILAAHPGEFPDVAAADGAPRRQHDKAQAAAQAFAFVHKSVFPFGSDFRADNFRAALGAELVAPGARATADDGIAMVCNVLSAVVALIFGNHAHRTRRPDLPAVGVAAQNQVRPRRGGVLKVPRLMVEPDRVVVVGAAGHKLRRREAAAVRVQIILAAHDAHTAGQQDGRVLQDAHARGGEPALQIRAAKARLPPVVEQVVIAEDVILAQRRVQLAKQLTEGVQLLRLGELIENIAGQHKQVGTARLDFCFQLRDTGVIHRRTGARVDITDLHDGQPAVRQIFPRCQAVFCRTEPQRTPPPPPHDKARQQPRRYAVQPDNTPNSQRCTADAPQRQPDGGTDAVECHKMSGKHDAQPERVAADIRQHAHQHKRQSVIQHRPPGHQL